MRGRRQSPGGKTGERVIGGKKDDAGLCRGMKFSGLGTGWIWGWEWGVLREDPPGSGLASQW